MHDTHFLERLERTSVAQTDLALSLYRDPELVRFILQMHAVDADRIAIAIDHTDTPPHVVVARDGTFVTCLGAGMKHALPVLPRARLDYLSERHIDLKTRLAYSQHLQGGALRKLWHAFFHAGHRLSREAFVAMIPLAPLVLRELVSAVIDTDLAFRDVIYERGRRLLERKGRWSSSEEELLARVWRDHWAVGHLLALRGTIGHEILYTIGESLPQESSLIGWHGLHFGFLPVTVRAAWCNVRHGPAILPNLKRYLTSRNTFEVLAASAVLVAFGALHGKQRAECAKALAIECTKDDLASRGTSLLRNLGATTLASLDSEPLAWIVGNLEHLRSNDGVWFEDGVAPHRARSTSPRDEALLYLRRIANLEVEAYHPKSMQTVTAVLATAARLPIEDLYWSEAELPEIGRYEPEQGLAIIKSYRMMAMLSLGPKDTTAPAPVKAPGRNEPCRCGSGKKYKRCCG